MEATEPLLSTITHIEDLTPRQISLFRCAAQRWKQNQPFEKFQVDTQYIMPYDIPGAFNGKTSIKQDSRSQVQFNLQAKDTDISTLNGWFNNMNRYLSKLPFSDKYTVYGYTRTGDVFCNLLLRNMFDASKFTDALAKWKYDTSDPFRTPPDLIFFPLYFQAFKRLDKLKKKDFASLIASTSRLTVPELTLKIEEVKLSVSSYDKYWAFGQLGLHLSIEAFWKPVIQDYIMDLNKIIYNSPPLPCDIMVYRGIKSESYLPDRRVCRVIGFLSTTASHSTASEFVDGNTLCCLQEIAVSKGVHCLPIMGLSSYPGEHEFVFGSDTILYISSKTDTPNVHKVALLQ